MAAAESTAADLEVVLVVGAIGFAMDRRGCVASVVTIARLAADGMVVAALHYYSSASFRLHHGSLVSSVVVWLMLKFELSAQNRKRCRSTHRNLPAQRRVEYYHNPHRVPSQA